MKLSNIKGNPNNPRIIKDDKFKKLVKSISEFPKMLELRPIIVDENFIVQGGNMRLKALQELKYKDIPDEWVKQVSDLTEEQKKYYEVIDNFIIAKNNDESTNLNKATYSTELCEKLLTIYTKEGDICYDPFMGTGTTGVACKLIGRNFIGSEISESQVNHSYQRVKNL